MHHPVLPLGPLRELSQAKSHPHQQVEGISMDLEPNLGVALGFAKLRLGLWPNNDLLSIYSI